VVTCKGGRTIRDRRQQLPAGGAFRYTAVTSASRDEEPRQTISRRLPRSLPELLRDRYEVDDTGCWNWLGYINSEGYGVVSAFGRKRRKVLKAHRIAHAVANGLEIEELPPLLMHDCDNRRCVNPKHLWPGTPADNARARDERGRTAAGERHPRAKLTEAIVNQICWLYEEEQCSGLELARRFGVSLSTIYDVIRERTWRTHSG
jgi:hypothetical protein